MLDFRLLVVKEALESIRKKRYERAMYRDLFFFCCWFILFVSIVFTTRDVGTAHQLESAMREKFVLEEYDPSDSLVYKNFLTIDSVEEFWQWIHGPFFGAISEVDDNGNTFILGVNRLLGSARLRQYRVRNDSCTM